MDKKLLDALANLSDSLDLIAQTLAEKKGESSTSKALEGGNFNAQIKEISAGVKKLQADNQKILKNQETILALSQKKEIDKKTDPMQKAGDKNTQKLIKNGVSIILLIAAGVLAMGLAFKLVGKIDFLSVVGLSIAIVLISVAFEKVANLKLTPRDAAMASLVMVIASTGIMAASLILSMVRPMSIAQALTAIGIAAMFTFISPAIATLIASMQSEDDYEYNGMKFKSKGLKFSQVLAASAMLPLLMTTISLGILASSHILSNVKPLSIPQALTAIGIGFVFALIAPAVSALISGLMSEQGGSAFGMGFKSKGISWSTALIAAVALPIVMMGISIAIMASSHILSKIQPISIMQGVTAIMIAGVFTVLAFGLKNIISAFGGPNALVGAVVAAAILPILFIAMSFAMMKASQNFAKITPIGFPQFLTALGISIIFVVLSFAASLMMRQLKDLSPAKAVALAAISVILFVALSFAIMKSSEYMAKTTPVDFMLMLRILAMGLVLTVVAAVVGLASQHIFSKVSPANMLLGLLYVVATAGAIMVSSWLIAKGTYDNAPSLDWGLGVLLAIGSFAALSAVIGFVAMSGIGFVAMLLGLGTMVVIAATIMEISKVLAGGDFSYGGDLSQWAKGVSLLYMVFTPIMMFLGAMGLVSAVMSIFGGPDPFQLAKNMMVQIADTIKSVSLTLAGGNYKDGPTIEWAYGVSRAISAFSYVYFKLQEGQSFWSKLTGGNAAEGFTNAIKMISTGITDSAKLFAQAGVSTWSGYPPYEWAKGVGLAIGAFAPVYKILTDQSLLGSLFGTNVTPEQMKSAMITIAEGIVEVGKYFNLNKVPFEGNYPKKAWGEGVGAAMKGFGDIYNLLYEAGWDSGDLADWRPSIFHILDDITMVAIKFTAFKKAGLQWIFPKASSTQNLVDSVKSFVSLYDSISWDTLIVSGTNAMTGLVDQMISVARKIGKSGKTFNTQINPNFIKNLTSNVISYVALAKFVEGNLPGKKGGLVGAVTGAIFGTDATEDPMDRVINGMVKLGNAYVKLSKSIQNFGNAINGIDVEKLASIRAFTSNIILMSIMDPVMFEDMLDKLEEKAGVMVDIIGDMNDATEKGDKNKLKGVTKGGGSTANKPDPTQQKILQVLASMDNKLGTIAKNSGTLADYTNELRTGSGVKIKK